jgi:hypothetical protein
MALKPCRECKEMVSTEAKACPHCGVRDPTGAQQRAQQRGMLGCLGIIAVIAIVIVVSSIGNNDNGSNATSTATSSKAEGAQMASIGNQAVATLGPVLACPEWKDYEKVIGDIVNHDKVGESQDFQQGGCRTIEKGDTGLIIGAGFTSIRVRLDKDETAYWTESQFGDPVRPLFVCLSGSKCGP